MNNNIKTALISVAMIIPTVLASCLLKQSKPTINSNNPQFASYISGYTQGLVSRKSTIKIKLPDYASLKKNANNIPQDLFSFSPSINGTVKLNDDNIVEFIPNEYLKSGVNYTGVFHLNKICDVPQNLEDFTFNFAAPKQDFIVKINNQNTINAQTLGYQQVEGTVNTADVELIENIQKTLSAKYNDSNVAIKWNNNSDKKFNFIIDSLPRGVNSGKLIINWDGSPIKSETKGKTEIEIPSSNDFKILDVSAENQQITLMFSDPIKSRQNLNGLIKLSNEGYYSNSHFSYSINGNCINIYPSNKHLGQTELKVFAGIQNSLGKKINEDKVFNVNLSINKPQVRTVKSGFILPESGEGLIYPFEAINLKAVDVTIIKIFGNNVIRYIKDSYRSTFDQANEYELKPVGVPVLRKTIHLTNDYTEDLSEWKRYSFNLADLIKPEEGAIYNIQISFRRCHAVIDCTECESCQQDESISYNKDIDLANEDWTPSEYNSNDSYEEYDYEEYDYEEYDWRHSDDPCYSSYYRNAGINQNIFASNLGIICKRGNDNSITVFVTNLLTAEPVSNAEVELISYQEQVLATQKTDREGKINFGQNKQACFAVAKHGDDRAFLKLADGNSLSMSQFEIGGTELSNGMRGYIYGERGVWRPGDSIHLTFILNEDELNPLPQGHPITLEVTNPRGQTIENRTMLKNNQNFYVFNFATTQDAPTGNYNAKITVGNAKFFKKLKVETVKPNRLKINTSFNNEYIGNDEKTVCNINSTWLHGAKASNLRTTVEVSLQKTPIVFKQWEKYNFNNASRNYEKTELHQIFDGKLDANGNTSFQTTLKKDFITAKANKYLAKFIVKVHEPGGSFSIDQTSIDYYPYQYMVGIKTPDGNDYGYLSTDENQAIDIVIVDKDGKTISQNHNVEMKFYKLQWSSWWEQGNYIQTTQENLLKCDTLTINGKGQWSIRANYPDWGRYYITARDLETGYESSTFIYMDWPSTYGRSPIYSQGATLLNLSSDKKTYSVGEKINISIPTPENGYALISLENGKRVISTQWIPTQKGTTTFSTTATEQLLPGCYVNVMMLQQHSQTINDLPIRMYGVLPINIEDKKTILKPQIEMPADIEAESEVKITISEQDNKEMTYTLAIVEDGILDITKFKTPNPWSAFFSREALGVKTWDMFDNVIGAFGGKIEKIFSIGGDDEIQNSSNGRKANRFQTVAMFYGPFTIKGGKQTHTIKMPKYIGSVRTMVVAGNGKAFGNAEKTSTVTKPLMIYGNMPRTLTPNDKFKLPVTVFAGKNDVKNVTVTAKAIEGVKIIGENSKQITFNGNSEQTPTFDIITDDKTGIAKVEVTATSGNHKSSFIIETNIHDAVPEEVRMSTIAVNPGQTVEIPINTFGRQGTNRATANISTMIPFNFQGRLDNLIAYPHGCLEQTISKAFPQLYLNTMTQIDENAKADAEQNIKTAIKKVISQQSYSGGLTYWPGETYTDNWVTSYAGQFMLEAKKKGYDIPDKFFNAWKTYQRKQSENWYHSNFGSYMEQSYRLYTMALAGQPLLGAMNRLKELPNLPDAAKYHLAAAYSAAGKKSVAESMINAIAGYSTGSPQYNDGTYGSQTRNMAIILQALTENGQQEKAFKVAKYLSQQFNNNNFYNTQTTAFVLMAMSKYYEKYNPANNINGVYSWQGKQNTLKTNQPTATINVPLKNTNDKILKFTNNGNGVVYVELSVKGTPQAGKETVGNNVLSTKIKYTIDGKEISPSQIKQGTDFTVEVEVTNNGIKKYDNISLMQIFPSGWEIVNGRIFENPNNHNNYDNEEDEYEYDYDYDYDNYNQRAVIRYTDIRDDRVCNYFSLPAHAKAIIKVNLNASYIGEYYLPGIVCEDMYDNSVYAKTQGMKTIVIEN